MATVLSTLVVEMRTNFAKFHQGMDKARKSLGSIEKSAKRTQDQFSSMGRNLTRVAGLVGVSLSVRQVKEYADSWTKVNNQLRIVAKSTGELASLTDQVFDAAQRTRAPVQALVTLYSRASLASDKLGASQSELITFSENVGKALLVNGTSAHESRGALIQLSQAIGAGTVRAEEFNAIMEGARPILVAVSKGLKDAGGDVAALRRLVIDGKVSSQAFFKAFLVGSAELEQQFNTTIPTIAQSFTLLENSVTRFIGELNNAKGATATLGRFIESLTIAIDQLDAQVSSTRFDVFFQRWAFAIDDVVAGLGDVENELRLLKDVGGGSVSFFVDAFSKLPTNITAFIKIAVVEIAAFLDKLQAKIEIFAAKQRQMAVDMIPFIRALNIDASSGTLEKGAARLKAIDDARKQSIADILEKYNTQNNILDDQINKAQKLSDIRKLAREGERDLSKIIREQELANLRASGPVSLKDFETQGLERKKFKRPKLLDVPKEDIDRMKRAAQILKELRNPSEIFVDKMNEIKDLFSRGFFGKGAEGMENLRRATIHAAEEFDRMEEKAKESTDSMSVYAEQAAKNMQDAFADFLFDPFDGGLKGMLKGFIDVIRRMAAEAAAAQIFGSKKDGGLGLGDFVSSGIKGLFGGGKASGGPVFAGSGYLVGEQGPELFIPQTSGSITPNRELSSSRSVKVIQNINVRDSGSFRKSSSRLALDAQRQFQRS